ncbi:MAG: hypothetical protein WAP07_08975, partial [Acutalibacteraceae bacterium]
VVPSLVGDPTYFKSRVEDLKWAIESLAVAAEYAEDKSVYLTIEPINRYGAICDANNSMIYLGEGYYHKVGLPHIWERELELRSKGKRNVTY